MDDAMIIDNLVDGPWRLDLASRSTIENSKVKV